jgi:tripartite motif-containing protein 71
MSRSAAGASTNHWGEWGIEQVQFVQLLDVTGDDQGSVYATNQGNFRVNVFTYDGRFIATWGRDGPEEVEFNRPTGLALDGKGAIYVSHGGGLHKFRLLSLPEPEATLTP